MRGFIAVALFGVLSVRAAPLGETAVVSSDGGLESVALRDPSKNGGQLGDLSERRFAYGGIPFLASESGVSRTGIYPDNLGFGAGRFGGSPGFGGGFGAPGFGSGFGGPAIASTGLGYGGGFGGGQFQGAFQNAGGASGFGHGQGAYGLNRGGSQNNVYANRERYGESTQFGVNQAAGQASGVGQAGFGGQFGSGQYAQGGAGQFGQSYGR